MIRIKGKKIALEVNETKSLNKALKENNIFLSAPCGGCGICGKCRIRVIDGVIPPSDEDRKHLSIQEIENGIRLACTVKGNIDAEIEIINDEEDINALSLNDNNPDGCSDASPFSEYGIAIDLGTTTLAAVLVDLKNGDIIKSISAINHQRAYGADVISRIKAASDGKNGELKESIRRDLDKLCKDLLLKSGVEESTILRIVIAGNTTMIHLLMGYSCEQLGVYPFEPVSTDYIETGTDAISILDNAKIPVLILPGISAFIGGDIVSGILSLGMERSKKVVALIDLGTNGEMAVGNMDKILVTSVAAGPAFEGGNITCGMPSVNGAVYSVSIDNGIPDVKTINDVIPQGLCGTGIVELTRELLVNGIIDETGLMCEPYEEGYCFGVNDDGHRLLFTQKDVRQVQLAKAAVRAGFETLISKYGITAQELDAVFIAGGFGYYLDVSKAVEIGMLPEDIFARAAAAGNTSIEGAVKVLMDKNALSDLRKIVSKSVEVKLSLDEGFNDAYINAMNF